MNTVPIKSRMLCECEMRRESDDRKYMDLSTLTRYTKVIKFVERENKKPFDIFSLKITTTQTTAAISPKFLLYPKMEERERK